MRTIPRTIPLPAPAAGADWSFTPSGIDQAVVMTVKAQFTTSAAVAPRLPALVLKDINGQEFAAADFGHAQTAGLAVTYTWARNFGLGINAAPVDGQAVSGPLPDAWLQPGDSIGSLTAAIDVADQWDQIVIRYYTGEHWLRLQRELAEARLVGQIVGD